MIPEGSPPLEPSPAEPGAAGVVARAELGTVPAFRAGSRDRFGLGVEAAWFPAERVALDARIEGLYDLHPDGTHALGFGDLELGALLRLPLLEARRAEARAAGRQGPAFGLGWRVKLPNAADEGELGSDETDAALIASAATDLGPLRACLGGGLAILGDPLMLAAQDDVGFLGARLGWPGGPALRSWIPRASLAFDLAFPSPSNPFRGRVTGALGWGRRWRLGVEAGAGLSPASPDLLLGLHLGWAADGPGGG
jgi:hypothetical protein